MERIRRCLSCMEVYEDHLNSCPFCGYKEPKIWDDQLILQPGTILQGRYIVGTKREEGETDITYIGWDGLFDRKVLIQEFFPNRIAKRDSAGKVYPLQGAEADLQRWTNEFVRQREKLILLCESRDVICVFSAFKENGTGYMTYQYADSPVLSEFIKEHGPISTELSKAYLEQAVKAVREVHSLGLIHGGISPDSFWMIQGDRRMVLKGFSEPCHSCGRTDLEDYGKAGPWTDIRGLALLFASLLSGAPRIDEKSALAVFAKTKMLSDVERKALSKALSAKSGQPGITLTEFSRAVLGERRTEELTTHAGNTRKKRSSKREDLRTKLLIGGVALIAGLLAMMAGVTAARGIMNRSSTIMDSSAIGDTAADDSEMTEEESESETGQETVNAEEETKKAEEETAKTEEETKKAEEETEKAGEETKKADGKADGEVYSYQGSALVNEGQNGLSPADIEKREKEKAAAEKAAAEKAAAEKAAAEKAAAEKAAAKKAAAEKAAAEKAAAEKAAAEKAAAEKAAAEKAAAEKAAAEQAATESSPEKSPAEGAASAGPTIPADSTSEGQTVGPDTQIKDAEEGQKVMIEPLPDNPDTSGDSGKAELDKEGDIGDSGVNTGSYETVAPEDGSSQAGQSSGNPPSDYIPE